MKPSHAIHPAFVQFMMAALLLAFPATTAAQEVFEWANPVSGDWGTNALWNKLSGPGSPPPGVGDEARFNESGTYTVTFSSSINSGAMNMSAGNIVFRSNGVDQQYRLNSGGEDATITNATLTLGVAGDPLDMLVGDRLTVNSGGTLNVTSGGEVSAANLTLGTSGSGLTSSIDVAGSTFTRTGTTTTTMGQNGATADLTFSNSATGDINGPLTLVSSGNDMSAANLLVEGDADLELDSLIVGASNASSLATGTVTVTGSGSTITQTGASTLTLGTASGNVGLLNIDGGSFTTGTGDITINATGEIHIDGGTLNANGNITLDGGTLRRTSGNFIAAAGTTLTASNNAQIDWSGAFSVSQGRVVTVDSGSDVDIGAALDIGNGTLVVDGVGTTLSSGGVPSSWTTSSGAVNVTVRNDAEVFVDGIVTLGFAAAAPVTIDVESGGALSFGSLNVGTFGGTVTVNVTGVSSTTAAASTLTANFLNVGAATGGAAVNVLAGGMIDTGAHPMEIAASGTVNIDGAGSKFVADGALTIDDGQVNVSNGGMFEVNDSLDVAGGSVASSAGSTLALLSNQITVQNGGSVDFHNGGGLPGNAAVQILSGGTFSNLGFGFLDMGAGTGDATLLVDGAGSDFSIGQAGSSSNWGAAAGHTFDATFSNEATATLRNLSLAAFNNSDVDFEVRLGADVTLERPFGASSAAGGSVVVTVQGAGSTLTITGPSDTDFGAFSDGALVLNVLDGGVFTKNDGLLIVGSATSLNIDGGTVVVRGVGNFSGQQPTFNFLAGSLTIHSGIAIGNGFGLFPDDYTLGSHQALTTAETTTVSPSRTLTLDGGTLVTNNLVVNGALNFNRGVLEISGGAITGLPSLVVPANGELRVQGNHLIQITSAPGSRIAATGNLTLGDAALVNGFYSNGILEIGSHTVALDDANAVVFDSAAVVSLGAGGSAGSLVAANGLTLDFGGNVIGYGTIDTPNNAATPLLNNGAIEGNSAAEPITLEGYVVGVGTFQDVVFNGTLAPGFSPAAIQVGNVVYGATATLEIELGGVSPSDGYDQVNSSGTMALSGTLDVSLINGFTPVAGNSFDILNWNNLVGTFATVNLPALAGLEWDVSQLYTDGLLAVVSAPSFAADFDNDGDVDGDDLQQWQGDFGENTLSDADDDGDSDGADLLAWQRQLGSGLAPAGVISAAVPEPAALGTVAAAAVLGMLVRRSSVSLRGRRSVR